ncbi:Major Facilitator Superfamily protein [Streptosporangium canum]|uniref:Major Facilitator Superfamily protein n=1 Tax=Streptosporangium canum TaxID=324952 RepID=A0A1I3W3L1_9ACTN|nr:MFS transporter [Streptosporangium canum]SFK01237.1 Major Facilitator Superfamily protein [Streptosporangium canum]
MISSSPRRRFLLFLAGGAGRQIGMYASGSVVTLSGLAVLEMGYAQIGLAQMAASMLPLVLALPLGVLVDRVRRRSALVTTGLLSAGLLASVAAAIWLDSITVPHFMLVVVVLGIVQAAGGGAQDAYLPAVVKRDRLVPVNAVLSGVASIGFLIVPLLLGEPSGSAISILWLVAAVACAASALLFRGIDTPEDPPGPRTRWWREAAEGVRFTLTHPALRAMTVYLVVSTALEEVIEEAAWPPRREPGDHSVLVELAPTVIFSAPAVGALAAALLYRRIGAFRLGWLAVVVTQPFTLLLTLTGTAWGPAWYLMGSFVPWAGWAITAIALLSHRQAITPGRLLGRVGGTLALFIGLAGVAGSGLEALHAGLLSGVEPFGGTWSLVESLILVLGTAGTLAAAVPLLKVRHLAERAHPPAVPLTSSPHED